MKIQPTSAMQEKDKRSFHEVQTQWVDKKMRICILTTKIQPSG